MKIIKTSEALPKSGRYVLAWLEGAKIPMRAMWAAQHTLPLGDDADPEWGEYSEEKDDYFCPAGWYEMNQHEEQHWGVSGNVVAWCELPRLEAGAAPAAVAGPARDWPDTCDGKEQEAFETWAQRERHNMEQHPLHYLFLNAETNAARQGWKAGLLYAVGQMKAQAAPALEAPAAPSGDEEAAFTKWFQGEQGKPYQGMWEFARAAWMARAATAAAPQAPAAPSAYSRSQHDADSRELRSLCIARDEARRERDLARVEIAGLQASTGHLSALVDSQHELLEKAKATMTALHGSASPIDESGGDFDARIPAPAFARFVDEHAALLYAMAQSPAAAPAAPAVDAEPLFAPGTVIGDVVRDTELIVQNDARYRLLRRGQHWSVIDGKGDVLRGDELDSTIDARLAAQAAAKGEHGNG